MRRLLWLAVILSFSTALAQKAPEPAEGWREEMQKLKKSITALLPYAVNVESFNSSVNAITIDNLIKDMKVGSVALKHHQGKFAETQDPTVEFVSADFEKNIDSIQKSLSTGRRDYARYLVLNTTSYCMECHTRTKGGPSFVGLSNDEKGLRLNPVERVEYLISIRQFQEALKLIEQTLKQDKDLEVFGNEKLVRYGMTTTIKYFQDMDAALKVADIASTLKSLPYFVKNDIKVWKESLTELKKEKLPKEFSAQIDLAQKWISKAQDLNTTSKSSHAGDAYLLRANAMLLELFKNKLAEKETPKALYLVGETYRLLPEHVVWTLHESYYEACIRKAPRTEQAQQCYTSLEDSILMGYTGSAGTNIPSEVAEKLKTLKKMSKPI